MQDEEGQNDAGADAHQLGREHAFKPVTGIEDGDPQQDIAH